LHGWAIDIAYSARYQYIQFELLKIETLLLNTVQQAEGS
jgi:hypothetical protein